MELEHRVEGCFNDPIKLPQLSPKPMKQCSSAAEPLPPSSVDCFDCNICLDNATEPVVTLCGHLYCWPCIYRWLRVETATPAQQQCPVCKTSLSESTLVPLYGRGHSTSAERSPRSPSIPKRPSANRELPPLQQQQQQYHHHHHHYYPHYSGYNSAGGGVLGGIAALLLPRSMHSSSPYRFMAAGNNARLRRREMEVERSLHQMWVFLLFCALLCLLFF